MKKNLSKKTISMILAGVIFVTSVSASDLEGANEERVSDSERAATRTARDFQRIFDEGIEAQVGIMGGSVRTDLYQYYLNEYKDANRPVGVQNEIVVDMADFAEFRPNEELGVEPIYEIKSVSGFDAALQAEDDKGDCLVWENDMGEFDFVFDVPQTGMYNLEFLYLTGQPDDGKNNAVEISFKLNGEHPFSATRGLELDKYWRNDGVIEKIRGHEQLPLQIQRNNWITYRVKDKEGLFNEPYFFFLEKGENIVTIDGIKVSGVAFKSMSFKNYPELPSYADKKPTAEQINGTPKLSDAEKNDIGSTTIFMHGQTPYWRSSLELGPTSDRSTYLVSPHHPVHMRYNTMGGDGTWGRAGQSATWEFTVPADGYYRISAKVRQNTLRGFRSNRRVMINGEVPVKEFEAQKFPYNSRWYQHSFVDDNGDDIYLFLEAGVNYITLEAVPGEIGESMQLLGDYLFTLNYLYRRILMVVGPNPDEFNDYRVDVQIPELIPEFERIRDALRSVKTVVERHTTGGGSEAATLETLAVILDRCIANPDRIPLRMDSLKDNIAALSAWISEASRQPLELDYIEVATVHEKFGNSKVNFFSQLLFLWNGFIGSFFEDYTKLDGEVETGSLNVWVGLGRDQALVLKNLLGDYNRDNAHNLAVSLNLVQGGILEASLAGKGPELALFIGGDFPVQLAARNMTVDVSKFDDYEEIVSERFVDSLPTFFTYLDGVYGLPLTQVFPMMFYREDILRDLGIEPPDTWDEFIEAIAVLNRAFLEIGLLPPLNPAALGSTIFEPGEPFTMLQLQTGQNFYEKDDSGIYYRTTFDAEASIEAFSKWTRFYTVYQFEQTYDPFTRFRIGQMPIVIMPYPFFNQLNAAAPEIRGLWNFKHVPGTVRVDEGGNEVLDISASSGATCGLIFNKAPDHDAAWDFLKWLTSDDIQTRFGQNMESMLGPLGRYETANKNALENLAWTAAQVNRLTVQRDALVEIPMIPANYSATRHIKNAFRAVVNENYYPRFAINSYNRDINAEITRKNAELESHSWNR
ncbi:MAG: extracellular solute-binding protein [Oscillospiraceae bacterium]|nr:extracellular solute-binding protein [Oscillospiraceae bacterium]